MKLDGRVLAKAKADQIDELQPLWDSLKVKLRGEKDKRGRC